MIMALTAADVLTTAQQIESSVRYQRSGGNTQILTADGRINPTACRRLASLPNVVAAGALREAAEKITLATLPNAPAPAFEVTPGFPQILNATTSSVHGVTVSDEIIDTLGAHSGDGIPTKEHGTLRVGSTYSYPSDGRRPGFGYAILVETNDQSAFDECWVKSWPEPTNIRALLLTTVDPDPNNTPGTIELSQLNPALSRSFDAYDEFSERTTRYAAPLALLIATVIGFASIRARRLQNASALHAGVSRADLAAIAILETLALALTAAIIAIGFAAAATGWIPNVDRVAMFQNLLPVSLAAAGAPLGAVIGIATTSEKHLFRYFKDR
jgi:hypothetical protein